MALRCGVGRSCKGSHLFLEAKNVLLSTCDVQSIMNTNWVSTIVPRPTPPFSPYQRSPKSAAGTTPSSSTSSLPRQPRRSARPRWRPTRRCSETFLVLFTIDTTHTYVSVLIVLIQVQRFLQFNCCCCCSCAPVCMETTKPVRTAVCPFGWRAGHLCSRRCCCLQLVGGQTGTKSLTCRT